ncbi:hypothetical protein RRG08_024705 [Elysia crispata]|uniref:Uncharacterized protein n=1 Tax=Elysia crispata TaxID=231223 RepID=A0AAE0YDD3_9GAST|nr:hypothetical protein RRG08_024705 [Elysia crispata]
MPNLIKTTGGFTSPNSITVTGLLRVKNACGYKSTKEADKDARSEKQGCWSFSSVAAAGLTSVRVASGGHIKERWSDQHGNEIGRQNAVEYSGKPSIANGQSRNIDLEFLSPSAICPSSGDKVNATSQFLGPAYCPQMSIPGSKISTNETTTP